ncbi:fructose-bisphosphatase class III [Rubripirellula reticaptiva]|uniref:Fructose-1,6-bisphosphatase class 3 n=1 Tax=Rubripirellula reticaptiva TaxID=2528013 RepID=A0A5C6EPZ8_9BACT|nr:fructose-bisphosphatase class III [Rubripirellula reticaptiva]TWU51843.1 Fructose-1,6-bisphosphatase class 3 [Rubripirellula reticaptiva]
MPNPSDKSLTVLRPLAERFPNVDSAMAEIARLAAIRTLPKGAIHVISDIHGEDQKLRHVINNASGSLRPLVEKMFGDHMDADEFRDFLTLIFYPPEVIKVLRQKPFTDEELRSYATTTLRNLFELVRVLAAGYSLKRAIGIFPVEYRELFSEMLHEPTTSRRQEFISAIVNELANRDRVWNLIHVTGRLVRNLAIYELIIGGDCWDRGPRGDRVVDYLRQQPNVSFVWGNHDVAWLGAHLGHPALICNVLRVSLRYRRITQIDEGYSIPLTSLEHLAQNVYGDDPAVHFMPKSTGLRSMEMVARMQKAAAVMQFKLEGQMLQRRPEWELDHRRLLHLIDYDNGSIDLGGTQYPLRDTYFPTIDPKNPYQLSAEEELCLKGLRHSFVSSQKLGEQMRWLVSHGAMYLIRDNHLIFHACLPVDEDGEFLSMQIGGESVKGRDMLVALEKLLVRVMDRPEEADLDILWYLWSGPCSPLFGKDRIATFERDFIADKASHHETKNPYFALIHEEWFCDKVLAEFDVDTKMGIIVNGHVPVKVDEGESPLKKSGKAVTIDGAFSEAYGDRGYTMVMEAERTFLALHHQFESVEAAVRDGVDIIPSLTDIRIWDTPRRNADTELGTHFSFQIDLLEQLIEAYRNNEIAQAALSSGARLV